MFGMGRQFKFSTPEALRVCDDVVMCPPPHSACVEACGCGLWFMCLCVAEKFTFIWVKIRQKCFVWSTAVTGYLQRYLKWGSLILEFKHKSVI